MKNCVYMFLCAGFIGMSQPALATDLAVPSYWGDTGKYDEIPEGSIALINPSNGVLQVINEKLEISPLAANYRSVVTGMTERGVRVFAYVPTGYFNHECDVPAKCQSWERIVTQIYAYTELYPEIEGIFFDETSGADKTCADYELEYARLRGLVHRYKEDANIIFNPGWATPCAVKAGQSDEIVLTFEGSMENYFKAEADIKKVNEIARERNVYTWNLVYSVPDKASLSEVVSSAKNMGVGYFYATNIGGNWQAGENTWGALPSYWSYEIKLFED